MNHLKIMFSIGGDVWYLFANGYPTLFIAIQEKTKLEKRNLDFIFRVEPDREFKE